MKRIIFLLMAVILCANTVFAEETKTEYSDFDISQYWFGARPIEFVIKGYEDGTFRPDNNITRAEFAKIVVNLRSISALLSENTPDEEIQFSDVDSSHWAYQEIKTAVNAGIISGFEDGAFRPEDNITHEQAIKMILSMLGYTPLAEMYGGYPTGYMALGYYNGFFKAKADTEMSNYFTIENMNEEVQKEFITRKEALDLAEVAFTAPLCFVIGEDVAGNGKIVPRISIGYTEDGSAVQKTIYTTSGAVTEFVEE